MRVSSFYSIQLNGEGLLYPFYKLSEPHVNKTRKTWNLLLMEKVGVYAFEIIYPKIHGFLGEIA